VTLAGFDRLNPDLLILVILIRVAISFEVVALIPQMEQFLPTHQLGLRNFDLVGDRSRGSNLTLAQTTTLTDTP
jgi:hypothetical protein